MADAKTNYNIAVNKQGGFSEVKSFIAQIAPGKNSELAFVKTLPAGKYSKNPAEKKQYRPGYKIFICGEHDEGTPVEQLPWGAIYGPSGLRNEGSGLIILPPNTYVEVIRHGERDGVPFYWIVKTLPNYNVNLDGTKTTSQCKPGSGFVSGSPNYLVSSDSILPDGSVIAPGAEANISVANLADEKQSRDGETSVIFAQPTECRKIDTAKINKDIERALKNIGNLRKDLLGKDSFLTTSQNFLNDVNTEVDRLSKLVTDELSRLIQKIREKAMRKVNTIVNNTVGNLYLSSRYQVLAANDFALDGISCLFLKILENLFGVVRKFLNELVNTYLNTGICVIESFLSSLLGSILAELKGALSEILGPLQNLLGSAVNLIDNVLGFVESILDFLTCDVKQLCPATNEWNFLEGGTDSSGFNLTDLDFAAVFDSANSFYNDVVALGKIPSSLGDFDYTFGIDKALDAAAGCLGGINGSGVFRCGPPKVVFWGADGSGTTADAVISAAGEILGVNIITPGKNYSYAPTVRFEDNCGAGVGANGTAVIGEYIDDNGNTQVGVIDVIIDNTGYNYLPNEDGSVGGMGRTIADRCQSLIRRADNTWDGPFNSGDIIEIGVGDLVILAGEPEYVSEENTSITAPPCPDTTPTTSVSTTYPVVVSIGDVNVANPGFGFQDGDTITVTPDNGAILEPIIQNGSIAGVNIINPGIGFDEMPELSMNTNTGYNALLNPVLSFKRVDDNVAFDIPAGTKLVSVVDCVGKN